MKLSLLENALLPRNQQRDKKSKSPHHSWERAENKNNKTPCRRKKDKNKITQKSSESSVETTTFIFPLQLCTIRLYTSKAVMLSSQHSECVCVFVS